MDNLVNRKNNKSYSVCSLSYCVADESETLLINFDSLNILTTQEMIAQFMNARGYTNLVIFNIPYDADVTSLKEWPKLKGLFYQGTEEHIFKQGLEAIGKGDLWFPRTVSDTWMRELLASEEKTTLQSNNLTFKEIKVLNLLWGGASSPQIADSLFISEASVRVHLHKIYQKINVKNKQKALQWCEKNLSKFSSSAD